ncbi:MAG: pilus assembly protein N-terminal domain-containing protein [Alphaproteobacteria bacterium]
MTGRTRKSLAWSAAFLLASQNLAGAQSFAPKTPDLAPAGQPQSEVMTVGQRISIALDRDYGTAITDEKVANIIPISARRIEVVAVGAGQTDIKLYDNAARPLLTQSLRVQPDFGDLSRLIAARVPGAQVEIDSLGGKIVLNGTVPTNMAIDQTVQLAAAGGATSSTKN